MNKRRLPVFIAVLLLGLLIFGYMQKENLDHYISEEMQQQTTVETKSSITDQIHLKYNYQQNGENYNFTLFEFGSTGCAMCKQMEPVLEEVRNWEKIKVNVVFMHIMKPENLPWMKYYGISAVPMQILLDKQGNEFFRHYGFISASDIEMKLVGHLSTVSAI